LLLTFTKLATKHYLSYIKSS